MPAFGKPLSFTVKSIQLEYGINLEIVGIVTISITGGLLLNALPEKFLAGMTGVWPVTLIRKCIFQSLRQTKLSIYVCQE